ncbi:hypothetical protein DRB96_38495 [Streptomyces sp. ICC1]|nr:hypothetical protein DRB89_38050 [Streptomyces sp. ICC4]AWZ17077.1 hypothetical protein DRB96_38495 [Streptomyces sp. ICC1]
MYSDEVSLPGSRSGVAAELLAESAPRRRRRAARSSSTSGRAPSRRRAAGRPRWAGAWRRPRPRGSRRGPRGPPRRPGGAGSVACRRSITTVNGPFAPGPNPGPWAAAIRLRRRPGERRARPTRDNTRAVGSGLALTGRVISCAALIMIAVFLSFTGSPAAVVKMLALGLAVSVILDATVVRLVLVPSVMFLTGRANWRLPRALDRVLPPPPPLTRVARRMPPGDHGVRGRSGPGAGRHLWHTPEQRTC